MYGVKGIDMGKQPYDAPKFEDFGSVADLTQAQGMTFTTDAEGTGSMAYQGMSGDAMR